MRCRLPNSSITGTIKVTGGNSDGDNVYKAKKIQKEH